jgi:hypothetical protein
MCNLPSGILIIPIGHFVHNTSIIVIFHTIDGLRQHKGATMNGAKPREDLWEFAQAIQWVDIWRCTVSTEGGCVQSNLFQSLCSSLLSQVSGCRKEFVKKCYFF